MSFLELFILAIGLSMDAFAVSVCKGLAIKKASLKTAIICGAWFGGFQALMPLIGYFLGVNFADYITAFDHWIAFILLFLIGLNMIRDIFVKDDNIDESASLSFKSMLVLAVATSIDALAVGITFAFLNVNIAAAVILIGILTFALSALGVKVGNIFGVKFRKKAELAGGVILCVLGVKILLEHLGVIQF